MVNVESRGSNLNKRKPFQSEWNVETCGTVELNNTVWLSIESTKQITVTICNIIWMLSTKSDLGGTSFRRMRVAGRIKV